MGISATMAAILFFVYTRTGSFITPLFIMASGGKYREVMVPASSNSSWSTKYWRAIVPTSPLPGNPISTAAPSPGSGFEKILRSCDESVVIKLTYTHYLKK